MNPWPFVIAAYGVTLASSAVLAIWAWLRMRDAEKK
ncbi:MAG: hypothetical protein JWL96_4292 [Sphingomonas bacterium]|jgi:hypothetical protein|nr:hypothetical protein [Sphingomonas bacterium]